MKQPNSATALNVVDLNLSHKSATVQVEIHILKSQRLFCVQNKQTNKQKYPIKM